MRNHDRAARLQRTLHERRHRQHPPGRRRRPLLRLFNVRHLRLTPPPTHPPNPPPTPSSTSSANNGLTPDDDAPLTINRRLIITSSSSAAAVAPVGLGSGSTDSWYTQKMISATAAPGSTPAPPIRHPVNLFISVCSFVCACVYERESVRFLHDKRRNVITTATQIAKLFT